MTTTEDDGSFIKKQNSRINHFNSDKSSKFLNLNLNQHKYLQENVQSFSKSNNDKIFGITVSDSYQEKGKTWNKLSSKDFSLKTSMNQGFCDVKDERQKRWKNDKNDCTNSNSSTLSLHIAAYENSVEVGLNDKIEVLPKKSKAFKTDLTKFQDPFEFPRQMEGTECTAAPDVQQFKASQKLFSPKQESITSSCSCSGSDDNDSELTTVPCTEIERPSKTFYSTPPPPQSNSSNNNSNNRFKHEIMGWSPDIYGNVQKFASGDCNQLHSTPKPASRHIRSVTRTTTTATAMMPTAAMTPKAINNDSSVYMMNYEQKLSAKTSRPNVMRKIEPPSGFAVPVKTSVSMATSDSDGPSKVFSAPIPLYHLKANPMHRGTFYKSAFESIQKLDACEMERATWTTPNSSPRLSVLHLSCNSGAVTAVNLATGRAIQKTLSSTSISAGSEMILSERHPPPGVEEESIRMMKLRTKWSSPQASSLPPTSEASDYGNEFDEAWDEVNKEIYNLQKMLGQENYENVYYTDEGLEYQRQHLHNFGAPNYTTSSTNLTLQSSENAENYDDFDEEEEEESEMQFMQPSEPSEFEKNVKFRHAFEKIFKGRYEKNGPVDRWLQQMTNEKFVKGPSNFAASKNPHLKDPEESEAIDRWLKMMSDDESVVQSSRPVNHLPRQYPHQLLRQQQQLNFSDDDTTLAEEDEEEESTDYDESVDGKDEDVEKGEEQVLQILSKCRKVMKQLESGTTTAKSATSKHSKIGFQQNLSHISECECDSKSDSEADSECVTRSASEDGDCYGSTTSRSRAAETSTFGDEEESFYTTRL